MGASKIARDISDRRQAQTRQEMLTRELHHRTKNLFAVVQSVVSRSFTGKHTVQDAETAVKNRLRSLAQTHALLVEKDWTGADLAAVVRTEMSPYSDRVTVDGPTLMLSAQAAQNFALAVHELATNAAKYGALSDQTGWVHISWSVLHANGDNHFSFRWQESGGPPVERPTSKGFGAVVLEQVMAEYFDVPPKIEFVPGGVCYELKGMLEGITTRLH
jgi:two-component sensor histidine kinase